jgi:hypothetical protein
MQYQLARKYVSPYSIIKGHPLEGRQPERGSVCFNANVELACEINNHVRFVANTLSIY